MELGNRLRRLRLKKNLTQEEMADRCELSKGFISQVERDLTSPSIATLADMLESLGTDLKTFFAEEDRAENVVYTRNDMFEKEDEEGLKGSILWLVPNAQKNELEPILVSLGVGGKTQTVMAHDGEEFGYVLKGKIAFIEGERKHKLSAGSSFSIKPGETHYIENIGHTKAEFIWVVTPPVF